MKFLKKLPYFTILGLGLLVASCTGSKKGYTITGTLPADMKVDSLYLQSYDYKNLQGVKVVNGKFEFKGQTDDIAPATLVNEKAHVKISFLLENADIHIVLKDKNTEPEKTGGEIYNMVYAYEKNPEHKKLMDGYDDFSNKLFNNLDMNDEAKVLAARKELDEYEQKIIKIRFEALDKVLNGNNPPIAKILAYTMADRKGGTDEEFVSNLEKMNKDVHSKYIDYLMQSYKDAINIDKNAENVAIGKKFIEVTGKDLDGKEVKLSEYVGKNKYTILEFWASWCGPCRGELPNLKTAYAKYKSKGLEIVSYSIDEKHADWVQATKEEKQPWINAIVDKGFENPDLRLYGVRGIPASYLIDQDGKILASNEGLRGFDLDKTLSKFIK